MQPGLQRSAGEFAFSGPPLDDLDDDDEESQSEVPLVRSGV